MPLRLLDAMVRLRYSPSASSLSRGAEEAWRYISLDKFPSAELSIL